MKILRLDLRAFGPFTDVVLDLSGGQEGLHLIYGPNEAGKSSALRALRQMLFGIDPRTSDRFLHDYDKLRVGGTLRRSNGVELAFVRRKGNKKVLRSPDESNDLDDDALDPFLGGIDAIRYETFFSLDHGRLLSGGRDVLAGKGDAGTLIFGAGTDLGHLLKLRKTLDENAAALFRPRGETYPLNRSLAKFQEASQAISAALIRSEAWVGHRRGLEEAQARRDRVEAEWSELQRRKSRLERIRQALPDIAQRRDLIATLATLEDAPRLPDGFTDDRRDAEQALRDAERTIRESDAERDRIAKELAAIPAPGPVLAESALIASLKSRHDAHQKEAREIESLRGECSVLDADARALQARLGLDDGPLASEPPRITVQQRERVRSLANDWHALVLECEALGKALDKLGHDRDALTAALDDLDSPRDAGPLRRALKRIGREGDPSRALEDARRQTARLDRQVAADLKKLAPWSGTLEDLETVPVPGPETIDAHGEALKETARRLDEAEDCVREADAKRLTITAEIAASKQGGDVPSLEELRAARARRDLLWRLVKADWRGLEGDAEALRAFQSFTGGDLATSFERSVTEADAHADRLRIEADRVSTLARLEADRLQAEQLLTRSREEREEARARRSEAEACWNRLWDPLGFTPATPKEMQTWVRQHAKLVEKLAELREAQATEAEQAGRVEACRAEISRLLRDLDEPPAGGDVPLADLLERAEEVLERIDATESQRRGLERQLVENDRNREATRRDEAEARRKHAEWKTVWARVIEPLGLDPAAKPTEANATLDKREELAATLEKLASHRQRIEAFECERERITTEARALADRVATGLVAEPLARIIEGLSQLLTEAHRSESRREALRQTLEHQEERGREGRNMAVAARERLDGLLREAGCSEPSQLPEAEERARCRRESEAKLQEVDDRLRNLSGGIPVALFLEEARVADPDGLPTEIERLAEQVASADAERQALAERIGEERKALQNMEESAREARATQAANEAQGLLARIESEASRYARLRLASAVLRQAIERYRERSQGPVLRRASTLFQQLTRGSFAGLTTEYDDDGTPRLAGQRPSGAAVGVEGMSEGTRDQLFLALKVASLEHHLDHHEPLPFIADDLLVNFDDERSQAALLVLAELSKRTQVLFFTHHRHLVELAEARLKPDLLFTHELPHTILNGKPTVRS